MIKEWFFRFPEKFLSELEGMKKEFPEFELRFDENTKQLKWIGYLTYDAINYKIEIEYPYGYPFIQPKIKVYKKSGKNWIIETFNTSEHILSDGSICLFTWDEGESGWKPEYKVTDALYKLFDFISATKQGKNLSKHVSFSGIPLKYESLGLIIPENLLKMMSSKDYGTLEAKLSTIFNQRIAVATTITWSNKNYSYEIKKHKEYYSILDPLFDLSYTLELNWYRVEPSLFSRIITCQTVDELKNILPRSKRFSNIDFSKPIVFFTKKSSKKAVNSSLLNDSQVHCIIKNKNLNSSALHHIKVDSGPFDDLFFNRSRGVIGRSYTFFDDYILCFIGLGSLGSQTADLLSKLGLKYFILVDYDILTIENLTRHALDATELYNYKVNGIKTRIKFNNPKAEVDPIIDSILNPIRVFKVLEIAKNLKKQLIFINTTANLDVDYLVNSVSLQYEIPAIYAYCNENVQMGRIFRIIPPKSPCFHCIAVAAEKGEIPTFPTENDLRRAPYQASLPGINIDIAEIAAHTARLTLQTIFELSSAETSYPKAISDHLFVVLHPTSTYQRGIYPLEVKKRADCPYCSNEDKKSQATERVRSILKDITNKQSNKSE